MSPKPATITVSGRWARKLDASEPLRGLCVKQPWCGLLVTGQKTIEVRSWSTDHRGPLVLCASLALDTSFEWENEDPADACAFKRGAAVGVVNVVDVTTFEPHHADAALVQWREGLFAWHVRALERLTPVPVRGKLGFLRMPFRKVA